MRRPSPSDLALRQGWAPSGDGVPSYPAAMPPAVSRTLATALIAFAACAPVPSTPAPPPPPADAPGPHVAAESPPAENNAAPPPQPPLDPRAVRCGVDDSPVEIGLRAPPTEDDATAPSGVERSVLGSSFRVLTRRDFSAFQLQAPGPPQNAPVDPGVTTWTIDEVRRDQRPLTEAAWPKGLLVNQVANVRDRVLGCGLGRAQDKGTIALEVRLAASGSPVSAVARGPGLDDVQIRCLGELACKLSLAPEAKASTLLVAGKVAFVPPVFKGTVKMRTRAASRGTSAADPAFASLDRALTKLAAGCAKATPPLATFEAMMVLKPDGQGRLSPGASPGTDAAHAIFGCVVDHLGEVPPVSMGKVRDDLLTTLTVTVPPP